MLNQTKFYTDIVRRYPELLFLFKILKREIYPLKYQF